ncbi:hydrogenase expression/formation protein [Rhodovulum sp. DZ06]|uniref:hydrogenase expression/formation protein n=1 Tax=Rhodovulum sp. DZ06 TaxID=3425126 RepID=UPI003D345A28
MQGFQFPPTGFGVGSQPDDSEKVEWMPMPSGMATYEPRLPEIDDVEAAAIPPALEVLGRAAEACARIATEGGVEVVTLDHLAPAARVIVAQTMGEGEVSAKIEGAPPLRAQESVFAGVWVVSEGGAERLEIGRAPAAFFARAFDPIEHAAGPFAPTSNAVVNAPGIVTELFDAASRRKAGDAAHVVNLTLLPHTPEDLDHIAAALGKGAAEILSRGYGNCRVSATALHNVWFVRFYNSMDTLILDSIEVTDLPEVVCAAAEDLEDSAERLREVMDAIR